MWPAASGTTGSVVGAVDGGASPAPAGTGSTTSTTSTKATATRPRTRRDIASMFARPGAYSQPGTALGLDAFEGVGPTVDEHVQHLRGDAHHRTGRTAGSGGQPGEVAPVEEVVGEAHVLVGVPLGQAAPDLRAGLADHVHHEHGASHHAA